MQQLLKFTNTIHEAFNHKSQVDTIYFDIHKAFDSVSHGLLLDRLVDIGTPAAVWKFMKAYLDSCQKCVCVDNNLSSFLPDSSGVPQGSILGPLLFLIYANDLSSYISKSKIFIYADDTKLCHEISCHNDFLELQAEQLTALQILPIIYQLELNDIMFYVTSMNNPSPHFNISDYILEHSSSISTRSQSASKLIHMHSLTNTNHHFYFNRLPRL